MARFILTRANGPNAGSVNVIGLSEEEMQILEEASGQADPMRNNSDGMTISNIPTHCVLNMLGQMGSYSHPEQNTETSRGVHKDCSKKMHVPDLSSVECE
ncbi:unnamed protein product [Cyprideis torosa]|uniref:Uncharacterized protein n=1 Tax=Cyprideis torosa TaxID=163714 RepID=A0A7R8WMR2_9CRUS|nr:unnamed protein product [Cyprideis torosa]CAG0899737.1 unnamed protein product [Cyprideis torosa]